MDLERLAQGLPEAARVAAGMLLLLFVVRQIPILHWVLYPFMLFNVFVHELAHVVVLLLTGGRLADFVVKHDNTGYIKPAQGGHGCLVANAGYLGATAVGAALLVLAASRAVAPGPVLILLGVLMLVLALFVVSNTFGKLSGVALAALLFLAGQRAPEVIARGVLWLLAVQIFIETFLHLVSIPGDAVYLGKNTRIPTWVWPPVWLGAFALIIAYALNLAYGLPLPWALLESLR